MASLALPIAFVALDNNRSGSRGAMLLKAPNLRNPTIVFPSLHPFHLPPHIPLPTLGHQHCQDAGTSIRAAWTRRSSGQRSVKKSRKSWGQRVDKYMKPFLLDINISRKYLSAKVTHRVTGKVVSGCTTNAKDLRNSLPSLIDPNACRTVGKLLAERAKAADVFAVLYEPRKNEKLEGKIALILDTILANDIALL